ncbi:DsbA family protein [Streptomyces bacillaris]|uniref:DsbA family oxidoreductase n=1 Tax=Streptomyces bacillaris TaxID=68179 RepID=UPI003354DD8D
MPWHPGAGVRAAIGADVENPPYQRSARKPGPGGLPGREPCPARSPSSAMAMTRWRALAAAMARSALPCASNCSTSDDLPNCSTSRETSTIVASARSTLASWARSTRARASSSDLVNRTPAEGLDIASHEVLEKLGVVAGLEPSAVRRMLEGTEFTENVRADERSARRRGVRGVPTLVADGGPPASAGGPGDGKDG